MTPHTPILFDRSLETGHEAIDGDHRELFWRVDRLLDASSQHRGRSEVERTLGFLGEYVHHHFATEERYMRRHGYPAMDDHLLQHALFVEEFEGLRQEFEAHGPSVPLVIRVGGHVTAWLRDHIQKTDRAFVRWLREVAPAPAPAWDATATPVPSADLAPVHTPTATLALELDPKRQGKK